jgi:hypothetical protein
MMKVKNILIFIVMLSSATLSAQNMIKIEPFLAIEGGRFPSTITLGDYAYVHAAASTVVFSPYNRSRSQGSSQGYYPSIGATFEYPVTKRLSFRAGIAYANRHFKADRIGSCVGCEENLDSYPVETIFRLGYIDIPLSARFYFLSKRITLYSDEDSQQVLVCTMKLLLNVSLDCQNPTTYISTTHHSMKLCSWHNSEWVQE